MKRRDLIKFGGLGLAGLGIPGCASRGAGGWSTPVGGDRVLHPVRVSFDRIIRTTVGLRPYRPAGFRVEAERLGEKMVVHDYGHGGAGMSLTWGTGALAADLALRHESRRAAVLGCGAAGLTAARQLQRRGFEVTIYTKAVPPDTTSNMSWASFTPASSLVAMGRQPAGWDARFREAAEISYRQLQLLVGRGYGVSWVDSYTFANDPPRAGQGGGSNLLPDRLRTGRVTFPPGDHPFPAPYANQRPALRIEPSIYLDALLRDVQEFGGHIVVRSFSSPRELVSLPEPVIVNCTGLGARDLFGDRELDPIKGQLVVLVPQPEVEYSTMGGVPNRNAGGFIHMMPRSDGIVLGGTSERGEWSLEPNEDARRRVIEEHQALFGGMEATRVPTRIASGGSPSSIPALESFLDPSS